MTHICVGNLTIIGPDNGLSPGRHQAIIWTNAGILLIGPWGTNFSEISIGIQAFSFKKMHFKMSSAKWRPFCLGFNALTSICTNDKLSLTGGWAMECLFLYFGENCSTLYKFSLYPGREGTTSIDSYPVYWDVTLATGDGNLGFH